MRSAKPRAGTSRCRGARRTVSYVIRKNNLAEIGRGTITPGTPAKIEAKLDEPGMVYVEVTENTPGAKPKALGAAVAPEKIGPAVPVPADFDAFWSAKIKALRKVPARPHAHRQTQRQGRRRLRHPQDESPRGQTRLGPGGKATRRL